MHKLKIFYFILFFLTYKFGYCQTNERILVEYELDNGHFKNVETLIANYNDAIKITGKLNLKSDKKLINNGNDNYTVTQKNIFIGKKTIFSNLQSDYSYIIMPHSEDKNYLVKDSIGSLDWKLISGEVLKVGKYNCEKATLNFRGRDYIAYYTTEIPVSFGPWKFKNLPGLILLIYSNTGIVNYSWKVKNIEYPYKNFNEPLIWSGKKTITLKQYIDLITKNSVRKNEIADSRVPKGTTVKTTTKRLGLELKYEWEN